VQARVEDGKITFSYPPPSDPKPPTKRRRPRVPAPVE